MNKKLSLWDLLYPIGIYYVSVNIAMFCFSALFHEQETYHIGLMIANLAALPFLKQFYVKEEKDKYSLLKGSLMVAFTGILGVVLNLFISLTRLTSVSKGFQESSEVLLQGNLVFIILSTCFVIPFVEEYLYRGIIYSRVRKYFSVKLAVIVSALLFAVMHFNIVQGLYAFLMGMMLAFLMEKYGLMIAVIAHGFTNFLVLMCSQGMWFQNLIKEFIYHG